jgi:hypothetical protein
MKARRPVRNISPETLTKLKENEQARSAAVHAERERNYRRGNDAAAEWLDRMVAEKADSAALLDLFTEGDPDDFPVKFWEVCPQSKNDDEASHCFARGFWHTCYEVRRSTRNEYSETYGLLSRPGEELRFGRIYQHMVN